LHPFIAVHWRLSRSIGYRPLATSIFAPAIDLVVEDFGEKSPELASFIVSVYLLGQCFGSLIIAPLSELYGRLIMYHICHGLFVLWTVGCALSPSIGALIGFRFLAGLMGSCPMTLGAGSIADMIPREKRGKYMSVWIFGPLCGPAIGPVRKFEVLCDMSILMSLTKSPVGGYLSEAMGWRWSLWLVVILVSPKLRSIARSTNRGL
jgi:MFS family permease